MPPEDASLAAAALLRGPSPSGGSASVAAASPTLAATTYFPGPSGGGGGRGGHRRRRRHQCASAPPPAPAGVPWHLSSDPPVHPATMFAGATPFAPLWTPPTQPPTWPGAHAFSTMGATPPVRTEWIADSGASFHTTPDASFLSSLRSPQPSHPSSIMVGDGSCLPVTSVGSALGPFCLLEVLDAPQMIHNLLSIRQFTTDNSCSVEIRLMWPYCEGFRFWASAPPL
jgi:hypothetical protein